MSGTIGMPGPCATSSWSHCSRSYTRVTPFSSRTGSTTRRVAMQTHKGPVATALTDRQAGLLDYLRQYAREYDGRLPSLYRMRGDMGMGVGQLYSTLDKLVMMGYVETDKDGTYRSIRLAEERP